MRIAGVGRLGVPALLLVAVAAAACGPAEDDGRPVGSAAVPSYEAPDGAPAFCDELAAVGGLRLLPVSIGLLVAGSDVEASTQISQVMRQLREVLGDVRDDGDHAELETALDDLVRALGSVVDGPLTDAVRGSVTAGLQQVGTRAQPMCGFPS